MADIGKKRRRIKRPYPELIPVELPKKKPVEKPIEVPNWPVPNKVPVVVPPNKG